MTNDNYMKRLITGAMVSMAMLVTAFGAYEGWQHSGSLYVITTPEGANLPATMKEENFPVLVRLNKDFFDFGQAKPAGDDVRFATADGTALAYQIEDWDVAAGAAAVWVRLPLIKGNERQEIKMYWGKSDAASESKGDAVFNESNGYLAVLHMSDPVKDELGSVEAKDTGTVSSAGLIGKSRRFDNKKGINCGEKLTTLPTGSNPHTTGVWIKPQQSNAILIGWGNEQGQGKVIMNLNSPPLIKVECYFSSADVVSKTPLSVGKWMHVVHTYKEGESRVYVDGVLDGESIAKKGFLNIQNPARMYIGGWSNNYTFVGEMDEVRVSKVTRSADWVKLEYENQKQQHTLAGCLVQPGSDFSASEKKIAVMEGKSATVSLKAGGAQKVYWILKRDGQETIVDVDRFGYTFDAGRVTGDQSLVLQVKAVFADKVKTLDIPITIQENIPDPTFALKAPSKWDGRETIEVVTQISNSSEQQQKQAGELKYDWKVSGLAVIKSIEPGKLILKRSQNSGKLTVTAVISNGGKSVEQSVQIAVQEPKKDAWVQRAPDKNEKAVDNQFYARDDKNQGTLYYNGQFEGAADSVFVKLYAGDKLIETKNQKLTDDKNYAFALKLKPGLVKYKLEFGSKTGSAETLLQTVSNMVCGDAYLIEGQSNALATDTKEESEPVTHEWIYSYGQPSGKPAEDAANLWCQPVWKARKGEKAELGWWGMELAKRLVESQKIPICIINGAKGGTRIDQHQRSETNPTDTDIATIYGRMLWRIQQAKLTHGIRGVLWHQGENNQGAASPTGDSDWKSYQDYFLEMAADWKQDFPNIQHYYMFQIWPNSCSMSGSSGCGDMIREKQRTLPSFYSNMDCMSTLGITPPGGCHYPLAGWAEFARVMQPLIERDHYGKSPKTSITAPNLKQALFSSKAKDAITLEFDQPVLWIDTLIGEFYLDGIKDLVVSGSVSGNTLTLKLKEASTAKKITYLKESTWSQDRLMLGANGIAALTFAEVEIAEAK